MSGYANCLREEVDDHGVAEEVFQVSGACIVDVFAYTHATCVSRLSLIPT